MKIFSFLFLFSFCFSFTAKSQMNREEQFFFFFYREKRTKTERNAEGVLWKLTVTGPSLLKPSAKKEERALNWFFKKITSGEIVFHKFFFIS